jgi:hypothetical protein
VALVDIARWNPPDGAPFESMERKQRYLLEPFEPAHAIRLCLSQAKGEYAQDEQLVPERLRVVSRSTNWSWPLFWHLEVAIAGSPADHECSWQETSCGDRQYPCIKKGRRVAQIRRPLYAAL